MTKGTPNECAQATRDVPSGEGSDTGPSNFLDEAVASDVAEAGEAGWLRTRFPPEPNGYLHIGHAKSICLNFGLARKYAGTCSLRFDDTNPSTEEAQYTRAIEDDIRWLGFDWGARRCFASDYFEQLYEWALLLIKAGKAYVDSQSAGQIRDSRGDYYRPGVNGPYRDRSIEENLDLFERMRSGEFAEGVHVLRAKIDMQHPNLNMRDPIMYRILHVPHHRTESAWCIYPTYDWAHGQSDAIEGITHSVCTLEFEDHRPLYDWFLEQLPVALHPRQIEFARLNLTYTVLSKRKLQELVSAGVVTGWDDPRMPTLSGMRRRGYTPEAIRTFCGRIGVSKRDSLVDVSLLEHALREDLNARCPRVMAVLRPLRVVIDNYPENQTERLEAPNHPEDPSFGSRALPFSRVLYIERDDFREAAPKKWFRLAPGREVRLRHACLVRCTDVIKNESGEVVELRCSWDPGSRGGTPADGRKVRGTLHWVSARAAVPAQVRLYDRLFLEANPLAADDPSSDWKARINPGSIEVVDAMVEPSLESARAGQRFQFERLGYFCVDAVDSDSARPVFNRTIGLRDSWARLERKLADNERAPLAPERIGAAARGSGSSG